jgi:hypothetical protein
LSESDLQQDKIKAKEKEGKVSHQIDGTWLLKFLRGSTHSADSLESPPMLSGMVPVSRLDCRYLKYGKNPADCLSIAFF